MSVGRRPVVGSDDAGLQYEDARKADLEADERVRSMIDVGVQAGAHQPLRERGNGR